MSSRNEKLELARKKLKQFKKQKNAAAADQNSANDGQNLSSNSSLNGNLAASSPGRAHSPLRVEDFVQDINERSSGNLLSTPNSNSQGYVIASMPPPDPNPVNSQIVPSIQFNSAEEMFSLRSELSEAVTTITKLMNEKSQLEALVEATKSYYTEHFSKNAEAYAQQVSEYQKSMQQGVQEMEKKYQLEIEYRKKLEEQVGEFQETQEKLKNDNKNLTTELEKTKEIVEEIQEKLMTKNNAVHNLEIKNEELTNSLELANLSLKQHRVSLMNLEDNQSKDRKSKFEIEKMQAQVDSAKESLQDCQSQNNVLKTELKNQRALAEKERTELKSDCFALKEQIESISSEKAKLLKQVEDLTSKLENVEVTYIPRTDVADINAKLQQMTIEKEEYLLEIDSNQRKIEKLTGAVNKITKQFDDLHEENEQLKSQSVDKTALIEKSESDRVTISRALTQNTELKKMYDESETKRESLEAQVKTLEDTVLSFRSKAELYDSTLQELLLSKNQLENQTEEMKELKTVLGRYSAIELVSVETNTEVTPLESIPQKEFLDVALDPVFAESSSEEQIVSDVSFEAQEVQTTEPETIENSTETSNELIEQNPEKLEALLDAKETEITYLKSSCENNTFEIAHMKERIEQVELEKEKSVEEYREKVSMLEKALTEKSEIVGDLETKLEAEGKANEESKAVSTNESKSLMDNYRKLQVKMQALAKECEVLRFQNNQLETTNTKLAGENDTIGDYILMYHAQREAMKTRDRSKSECLEKMVREKETLTEKVQTLEYLLTSILTTATQSANTLNTSLAQTTEDVGSNPGGDSTASGVVQQAPSSAQFIDSTAIVESQQNGTESDESTPSKVNTNVSPNINVLNNEIRAKMIEALETVKSVSIASKEETESLSRHFSTCKCCEGQLLMV